MASDTVYMHAHIQAMLTMEFNAGDTLGNQRRVQQTKVDQFEGEYGMANAPMLRRGSLMTFDYNPNRQEVAASRVEQGPGSDVFGVLAEAVADTNRRKPRPGRKPEPFVMPITFEGVDIITATERSVSDFYPGDPVYIIQLPGQKTMLHSSEVFDDQPGIFVGIAHVGSSAGTDTLQVRVDTLRMV